MTDRQRYLLAACVEAELDNSHQCDTALSLAEPEGLRKELQDLLKLLKRKKVSTNLKLSRSHSESGNAKGRLNGRKLDYEWNSHELWINGECNPQDDETLEDEVGEIFRTCQDLVKERYKLQPNIDLYDVGFEAEWVEGVCTKLVLTASLIAATAGRKLKFLTGDLPLDLGQYPELAEQTLVLGVNTFDAGGFPFTVEVGD